MYSLSNSLQTWSYKKNSRNFCRKNSLQIINSNSDRFFLVSECSGEHLRGGDNYIDSIDNNMNNLSIQEKYDPFL
jgi:hypothetical protein